MLNDDVDRYIQLRRALGYNLYETERRLRTFASYAAERGEEYVRTPTAAAWAASGPSPHARYIRFRDLKRFSQFVHGDDAEHDLLYGDPFPTRWHRPVPYIYSRDEIARLIAAAARLPRTWQHRGLVMSTALGLIASTGLRAAEALSLRLDDLYANHLVVRMTKFRKSRIIPLHPTVQSAMAHYIERRRRFAGSDDHLFVGARGRGLSYIVLRRDFHAARVASGVDPKGRRTPRIHDLRHTFATRALEASENQTREITQHHLALSTYLGHTCVHDTYWYMEATPELMAGIAAAGEKLAGEARS